MDSIPQDDTPRKQCCKCKQVKPIGAFSLHRGNRDGLQSWCKECQRKPLKRAPVPEGMKRCSRCKECKPATVEYFFRDAGTHDGLGSRCKPCEQHEYSLVPGRYKRCNRCQQEKPATLDYFWLNRDHADALESYCKDCGRKTTPREPVPDGFKRCCTCKQIKPATDKVFSRAANRKDGLGTACKECCHKKSEKHRLTCDIPGHKICYSCLMPFPATLEYFAPTSGAASGLGPYCKPCNKQIGAHQTRIRRARKKAIPGSHTTQEIQEQYKRQKGKCYYCRQKVKWGEHHVDHTFPITRENARNSIDHLVITCKPCNSKKSNKYPWEFFEGGRLL